MQITIEIPDEMILQLNQTGSSVQELLTQLIQKHIYSKKTLAQTQTWQLCGSLQVKKDLNIHNVDSITNYAENIDDVLYGSL
ncbi:MAG: hypothetical protein LH649_06000 [Pseudanabaena sp. CAN_BIN31]|nr:hypothetical protein [Pseudanabaena sp. CAN_BIN31]